MISMLDRPWELYKKYVTGRFVISLAEALKEATMTKQTTIKFYGQRKYSKQKKVSFIKL